MVNSLENRSVDHRTLQWIVVAGWIVAFAVLGYLDMAKMEERRTPLGCALGAITAFAHGAWITLDLKALSRPVRAWRFGAFFLGPLVLWLYFIMAYRLRAFWMIPLSAVIYLIPVVIVEAALRVFPPA